MNIEECLNRIKFSGEIKPILRELFQLQKSRLFNVSFENPDIIKGISIVMDIQKQYNKIVLNLLESRD